MVTTEGDVGGRAEGVGIEGLLGGSLVELVFVEWAELLPDGEGDTMATDGYLMGK